MKKILVYFADRIAVVPVAVIIECFEYAVNCPVC